MDLTETTLEPVKESEGENTGFKPRIAPISEGDLKAVLDSAVNSMPDVDEGLTDEPSDLSDGELNHLDLGPDVFDPAIHETDANGNPVKNGDGSLRRKRGRKRGMVYSGSPVSAIDPADIERTKAKAAATATVETILAIGATIGGEEWSPRVDKKLGIDERGNLIAAYEAYFIATGTIEIPPWLGVIVATGCFAVPRLAMPQTQSRLGRVREWWRERRGAKRAA